MKRDLTLYPQDPNGDVLWELAQKGEDLTTEREIDFPVLFPTEAAALQYAVELLKQGQKVSFTAYDEDDDLPWQVTAHQTMLPLHADIGELEELLDEGAQPLGGRTDGWGFYSQED